MKILFVTAAVLIGMASPAFAKHCPKDAKIIEQSLASATGLTSMQMTAAKALHDKGVALHKSGDHGASIKALHAATKILGVKPCTAM